ncbi:hypothetical protein [Nocardioides sp. MH1]|uniref:hypothetical protein n=1 Tax=Nocardioides sp. MH1 TaxID=3242490 RepID=UPI003520C5D7
MIGHTNQCNRHCILDIDGLATMLGISESHLADERRENPEFPAPRYIGRIPRWICGTVLTYIAAAADQPDTPPNPTQPTVRSSPSRKDPRRV